MMMQNKKHYTLKELYCKIKRKMLKENKSQLLCMNTGNIQDENTNIITLLQVIQMRITVTRARR